jgi:uncharacterized protein DUF4262
MTDPERRKEWARSMIDQHGWGVLGIAGEQDPFSYTVGLQDSFQHPELLLSGMKRELGGSVLNSAGAAIREGERFRAGDLSEAVLEGYPVAFALVPIDFYYEEFGALKTWRDGFEFTVLQCVWPDREGRFPWSGGSTDPQRIREAYWWTTASRSETDGLWGAARAVAAASLNATCRLHSLDPKEQAEGAAARWGLELCAEFMDALSAAEANAAHLSPQATFDAVHELLPAFVDLARESKDEELREAFASHFYMRSRGTL